MPTVNSSLSTSISSSNKKQQRNSDNKIPKTTTKTPVELIEKESSMPSNITNSGGVKTPQEQPEFIKQALIMIEKKVRNLDKRRIKLEEYKESQSKGTLLNEDQLNAVSKYDEVLRTLELAKELEKQLVTLANDALKQQKKQAKKEQIEREEAIKEKLKEANKYLTILNTFANENIRNDFLNETNGAFKLSKQELELIDEFNKVVKPISLGPKLEAASIEAADHLVGLIESKNKSINSISTGITYLELRKLFDRILIATYWDQQEQQVMSSTEHENQINTSKSMDSQETSINKTENLNELGNNDLAKSSMSIKNNQTTEHNTNKLIDESLNQLNIHDSIPQQQSPLIEQGIYHQQNTSDGYVLVSTSSSDINETIQVKLISTNQSPSNQHSLSIQQHSQQQNKTFFTTLNQSDLPANRNINEFLNRCENNDEGINFLQDSEIQNQNHQELHQQNKMQHHQHSAQEPNQFQQIQPSEQLTENNSYQLIQQNQQLNSTYFNSNQDFSLNDQQKDSSFKQRNRDNTNRNYQSKPRYSEDRRSGVPPRNNGSTTNRSSFNSRNSNNNNGNSYRGVSNQGGNTIGNRSTNTGFYRNSQNVNTNNANRSGNYNGQRNSSGNNNYHHSNRTNQDLHNQQQPQVV